MTLQTFLDRVDSQHLNLTVYAPTEPEDLSAGFRLRNVSFSHRSLPDGSADGFIVIRDRDGAFLGSIGLDAFREFLEPPVFRPWDDSLVSAPYQVLLETLENTLWYALDRRQLLATTREIENRAWRVGCGALHVGFQRRDALRQQVPVYAHLGRETDLEIHVYLGEEYAPRSFEELAVHIVPDSEIDDYWVVAFDGGHDELQSCALLAKEREPGLYAGFWTYDPSFVEEILTYLERTY